FALKIAEAGGQGPRTLIMAGEPFSSVSGYRERVKAAFGGAKAIDLYGLGEVIPLATECAAEAGLHVDTEFVWVEVVDPESGQPVPPGEKGELVVSHLRKEAMPLIRFRTGDLTVLEEGECPCGARYTLSRGVFGRTDEMHKVKGVKLYPSQIGFVLAGIEGVSPRDYRVTISTSGTVDRWTLEVQGTARPGLEETIAARLKAALLIAPDEVRVVPEVAPGPRVVDRRYS
ncbi:MAG: phenylacetate--CoA ligase family protein, partial [Firmicutes bacterium]|nr:phenylacetate--CoA ligase family protein [Bacillota bacterium]